MIPFVWHDDMLRHDPGGEVFVGVRTPGTEVAARAEVIRAALLAAGAPEVPATAHDDTVLTAVHEPGFLAWLATAWDEWAGSGLIEQVGAARVVPYLFPTEALLAGHRLREAAAVHARAGRYCYDTMTLVGPDTWAAARAAVDVALTAVDLVATGRYTAAYAACRPPGHHAGPASFGGSCYLNHAAVAAQALRAAGHERVAVVDVDAHQGNGTQAIFYARPDVLYASVHVDPGAGWFPHYVGFTEETGRGDGVGATLNVPVDPGSGDGPWLAGVQQLVDAVRRHGATALVVSLGVDAHATDPESPLQVSREGYAETGRALAASSLPTVVVQEGGYHLDTLGGLVTAFLTAF